MKRISAALLIALAFFSCGKEPDANPSEGTPAVPEKKWQAAAAYPGVPVKYAASFVIGDQFYTGLGNGIENNAEQHLPYFHAYNGKTNSWKRIADFPGEGRQYAISFSIDGKGYVGLGFSLECPPPTGACDHVPRNDLWEYDPATDSWKELVAGDFIPNSTNIRSHFVVDDKLYILQSARMLQFDPKTMALTEKSMPSQAESFSSGFVINNKAYITVGGTSSYTKALQEYNPATDQWTRKADFPGNSRRFAIGFALDGKGYIGGGEGPVPIDANTMQITGFNDVYVYDPIKDNWSKAADIPGKKPVTSVAGVVNGKAIVGSGFEYVGGQHPFSDFLIFQ